MHDKRSILLILIFIFLLVKLSFSQDSQQERIYGSIQLDSSWQPVVYLSYISSFNEMFTMSDEMIIANSEIEKDGTFEMPLDFLPESLGLYRLHVVKKDNSKLSLSIGGEDENHMFFIANRNSSIQLKAINGKTPFEQVEFVSSEANQRFHQVTEIVNRSEQLASQSGLAKRNFIMERMNEDLRTVADTTTVPLVGLYALHLSDVYADIEGNQLFLNGLYRKWNLKKEGYGRDVLLFSNEENGKGSWFWRVLFSVVLIISGFLIGRLSLKKKNRIRMLSVQERKVFEMLKKGATNQEIADAYNIGISTVKSHVSKILNKLNLKSRKEVMNF